MKKQKTEALLIRYVQANTLKPAEYNPRTHDAAAQEKLRESISRFGLVDPILVNAAPNRGNIVIGGHFRLQVAQSLGIKTVPVVYLNIPNLEHEKELNLRLNRNTGEWDYELLKAFDLNMLEDVGFDPGDLAHVWDETLETEDDDFDVEKEVAAIKKPKTKFGTLYALGNHRLLCGNSTDPEDVKRLVGKRGVGFIACDPPYNIGLSYDKGVGTAGKYGGHKTDDNLTDKNYRAFIRKTMENALASAKQNVHAFYWCDESYIWLMQELFRELGLTNRRVCMWLKDNANPTPGVAFNKVYEPCVYATRGKPYLAPSVTNLNEVLNKEVGTGNQLIDDVTDLFNIWLVKRLAAASYEHPTSKNPTLHEKSLRRCTKPGDFVLDLFGGSGSTLIACEQLKRRALLCEQEPIFCDVIVNRYEKLTGNKAEIVG